jgi:hypothetical protein
VTLGRIVRSIERAGGHVVFVGGAEEHEIVTLTRYFAATEAIAAVGNERQTIVETGHLLHVRALRIRWRRILIRALRSLWSLGIATRIPRTMIVSVTAILVEIAIEFAGSVARAWNVQTESGLVVVAGAETHIVLCVDLPVVVVIETVRARVNLVLLARDGNTWTTANTPARSPGPAGARRRKRDASGTRERTRRTGLRRIPEVSVIAAAVHQRHEKHSTDHTEQ